MKFTKTEKSWILYDVANSAFSMIISTTIPIYFTILATKGGVDLNVVSGSWGTATAISVLILAVLSPFLGALADYKGMKKKMLLISLIVSIIGIFVFTFTENWLVFAAIFIIARLGYSSANVFYDAMLTDVTTDERMDQLSANGYAWGYIGSCIPFIIGIIVIYLMPFNINAEIAFKVSFVITAFWWSLMSIPLLKNVKHVHYVENREDKMSDIFRRLGVTLKKIQQNKKMLYFIIGYFCYIDGVYTIISMATIYGGEVGIDKMQLIGALLLTQFVAFPFAILAGRFAKKYGSLTMIKIYIAIYIFICIFGYQLDKAWEFWVLAFMVGLAQGGIQSLSRSYFAKIIPKDESNEYFGFFDIFGKFADFLGPLLLSISALVLKTSKYGILSLIILFVIGLILILKADKLDKAKNPK